MPGSWVGSSNAAAIIPAANSLGERSSSTSPNDRPKADGRGPKAVISFFCEDVIRENENGMAHPVIQGGHFGGRFFATDETRIEHRSGQETGVGKREAAGWHALTTVLYPTSRWSGRATRSLPNTPIAAGWPICTVFARAETVSACRDLLELRASVVRIWTK